mmetsp:Transcript_37886/g.94143  ORF Transcript_37886/g.94143 Transcript_37886/m.94143 type:complete len:234 (-) Transcript_37886:161-862(-)
MYSARKCNACEDRPRDKVRCEDACCWNHSGWATKVPPPLRQSAGATPALRFPALDPLGPAQRAQDQTARRGARPRRLGRAEEEGARRGGDAPLPRLHLSLQPGEWPRGVARVEEHLGGGGLPRGDELLRPCERSTDVEPRRDAGAADGGKRVEDSPVRPHRPAEAHRGVEEGGEGARGVGAERLAEGVPRWLAEDDAEDRAARAERRVAVARPEKKDGGAVEVFERRVERSFC